ncbi:hypothetical protein KHA80_09080 [Anaerobacillus sp. HL2]|nr:hypothetical protein KHA80_09080 [Anaerobacillus sp. HL2]
MRLVTRSDFIELVSAMLLKKLGMIDEMTFIHLKTCRMGKLKLQTIF